MNFKLFTVYLLFVFVFSSCDSQNEDEMFSKDHMWWEHPAEEWEKAMPLGNGRIGVMAFGSTDVERIQLNDDSLWPGNPGWDEPLGRPEDLEQIRELLREGKNEKADQLFVEKFSRKTIKRSHQTLGDLFITLNHKNVSDYRRELDISQAIATTTYKEGEYGVKQEVFVSHPDDVIAVRIITENPEGLKGSLRLSRPLDEGVETAQVKAVNNDMLVMSGMVTQQDGYFDSKPFPILDGINFSTALKVENVGGKVIVQKDSLLFEGVRSLELFLTSNSSFYSKDYAELSLQQIENLANKNYDQVKEAHIADYREWYDNCQLVLTDQPLDSLPIDKRLDRIKEGKNDLGLESLLFQFGRYLLISSSRPGTLPANLQGLWNEYIAAPWNADYHLNINLQMNYWLADLTGLSALNGPLFDFIDRLIENGKTTATINFGCRGSFIPHATDIWAPTYLRAPTAYWGCSVGAGGWMIQHYWNHFEYTLDTSFLSTRAFPALQEVTQFYSDWLITDPSSGLLVSSPSTSPENQFIKANGMQAATCMGSAMDQQVITEVFRNFISACEILDQDNALLKKVKEQYGQLRPGFILGEEGRILEWDIEYEEPEPGHRHISHVYGFHPGNEVTNRNNPKMVEAVKKTLNYRLENGGAGTGWSRAWLINFTARLLDGEAAHSHIQLLFQKSILENLLDIHPPFQIDGNFGYTSGIAEMLLQSHEKRTIRILPALPIAWASGKVQGLHARGGVRVDITWEDHQLTSVTYYASQDIEFEMIYQDQIKAITLNKGQVSTLSY